MLNAIIIILIMSSLISLLVYAFSHLLAQTFLIEVKIILIFVCFFFICCLVAMAIESGGIII